MAAVTFFQGIGPHNLIFSNLRTVDLLHLSQTCRTIRDSVLATCFNIETLLFPFFRSHVKAFRELQEETGTLISGSTALLFFLRTSGAPETYRSATDGRIGYYPSLTKVYGRSVPATERDLDIYMEYQHAPKVAKFLELAGYKYSHRKRQDANWRKELIPKSKVEEEFEMGGYYLGRGIQDVLDFYQDEEDAEANKNAETKANGRQSKPLNGMKIQLISAKRSPIDIILTFHSTCVMNIISSRAAYSFFPHATFVEHTSLDITTTTGVGREAARAKYRERGWSVLTSLLPYQVLDPRSDFRVGFRWVGDRRTWTIPLSSANDSGSDLVRLHSFGLEYKLSVPSNAFPGAHYDVTGAKLVYELCESEEWKNVYAFSDRKDCQTDWKRIRKNTNREERFDLEKKEKEFCKMVLSRRSQLLYNPTFHNRAAISFD